MAVGARNLTRYHDLLLLCPRTVEHVSKLCEQGRVNEAIDVMDQQGIVLTRNNAYCLLQQFANNIGLECLKRVHSLIILSGLDSISALGDHLIRWLAFHGDLFSANHAFHQIVRSSAYTWSAIISANAKLGQGMVALELYLRMQFLAVITDRYVFLALLKACTMTLNLMQGRLIHDQIIRHGHQTDVSVGNTLIDMYSKCGSLDEASEVFYNLPERNVVSWNAMITGYSQHGDGLSALRLFKEMQLECVEPDRVTFLSTLKACGSTGALEQGRLIHRTIVEKEIEDDALLNTLVDMYAKCSCLKDASEIFSKLPIQDVVSWSAMIAGYAQHGEALLALECFEKMQHEGIKPTGVSFLSVLKACISIGDREKGRAIHHQIIDNELEFDVVVGNAIIDMYVKCGCLYEACNVFGKLLFKDVVSWGTLIAGYVQHGEGLFALQYFQSMQWARLQPNRAVFLATLKACSILGIVEQGRVIHDQANEFGFKSDISIGSSLIDMYSKCGSLDEACNVFDKLPKQDVVAWSAMIAAFSYHEEGICALEVFQGMQEQGIHADVVTFLSALKACAITGDIEQGRLIHGQIIQGHFQLNVPVGNALIDMYAKLGSLDQAHGIFVNMPNKDVISWGAMIAGYAQHESGICALEHFEMMREDGIEPDAIVLSSVLKACGIVGAIEHGKFIHRQINESGYQLDVVMGSTLVDMYAKCGDLDEAQKVFAIMPITNVVSWSTMIAGYAQHGEGLLALDFFEKMQQMGIKPDEASMTCVLFACSHAGLVDEGHWHFKSMADYHCITPSISHCTCMVDLLCRAGSFREAEDLLKTTVQPNVIGWMSLLSACRMHGNTELGRRCFNQVINSDTVLAGSYVLMSNIYADPGLHESIFDGKTWIAISGAVHSFDEDGKCNDEIYALL